MSLRLAAAGLLTLAAFATYKPGAGADDDPTGKAPNKDTTGAVVESITYSRDDDRHALICVAPGDRVFEVTVPEHVADRYFGDSGEPCPTGYPRQWWPQDSTEEGAQQ